MSLDDVCQIDHNGPSSYEVGLLLGGGGGGAGRLSARFWGSGAGRYPAYSDNHRADNGPVCAKRRPGGVGPEASFDASACRITD